MGDFFTSYLEYSRGTEVPLLFHRWSAIGGLGAYLGRKFQFRFGHTNLNPNQYIMLMGLPGTRKSTAIKMFKRVLSAAGYTTYSREKDTKESFLLSLSSGQLAASEDENDILSINLWGANGENTQDAECLICADEFNTYFAGPVLDFVSLLGDLWDKDGKFESGTKNSTNANIWNPTISILGGNTPVNFNTAFPTETLGQGFFSRLLLIYGEPTGEKITFPRSDNDEELAWISGELKEIKRIAQGQMDLSPTSRMLLDKMYKNWKDLDDPRFTSYSSRRFTHLLKLCLIHTAANKQVVLTEDTVIYTNTILSYAEHFMPRALGEFGKAKHSDVTHKIIQILDKTLEPIKTQDIWKHVNKDLDKITDLAMIMNNLYLSDKVLVDKHGRYFRKVKPVQEDISGLVDFSLLTREEQEKLA